MAETFKENVEGTYAYMAKASYWDSEEGTKHYRALYGKDPVLKDTNPKDAVGVRKVPLSTVPSEVMLEIGLAMLEGSRKYGRHNYRIAGVRASVYYDALMRHMMVWWEGEDDAPDSGVNHIVHAMACLTVLRDAMINDMWEDDRPPGLPSGWMTEFNERASAIIDKYPTAEEAFTQLNLEKEDG